MAEIKDCVGRNVKISKNSITIKNEDGKTCGVVRGISSLYDLQPNRQFEYYKKIKDAGLHGKISIRDCIISDGVLYVFRNIKSKLFFEKYGYFTDEERRNAEKKEKIYIEFENAGFEVINCIFV